MKIKKKLDYLTLENFLSYYSNNNCINKTNCSNCPFRFTNCDPNSENFWLKNKDVFSDDFLYQEIEFDVKNILTNEEKEYLKVVLKPFKNDVLYICKTKPLPNNKKEFIRIELKNDSMIFPNFTENTIYKGMKINKKYTLKDLDLVS